MEDKFPKSLIVVLWFIVAGLFLNASLPFIGTPAVASNGIQKIAFCDPSSGNCTKVFNNGNLSIRN